MSTTKPIIEIHYWGGEMPGVKLPPGLDVELKFIDDEEDQTRILAWRGVEVFATHNDFDIVSDYWVSTCPGENGDHEHAFDLRDLPEVPEAKLAEYRVLVDDAMSEDDPMNRELVRGHSIDEDGIFALMYCIDQGWLNEQGLTLPKILPT